MNDQKVVLGEEGKCSTGPAGSQGGMAFPLLDKIIWERDNTSLLTRTIEMTKVADTIGSNATEVSLITLDKYAHSECPINSMVNPNKCIIP